MVHCVRQSAPKLYRSTNKNLIIITVKPGNWLECEVEHVFAGDRSTQRELSNVYPGVDTPTKQLVGRAVHSHSERGRNCVILTLSTFLPFYLSTPTAAQTQLFRVLCEL